MAKKKKRKKGKKSFNPFKMWGSYVGLGIALIIPLPIIGFQDVGLRSMLGIIIQVFIHPATSLLFAGFYISVYSILGFLLGWGIHSLVRWLKTAKRKKRNK